MRDVDAAFAEVLRWRERQPDRDGIVVIALSDHGHVTGEAQLDLQAALRAGGFAAGRDFGATIQSPADLTDIAPSVLALLGLTSDGMDGRALSQAWGEAGDADPVRAVIHPVAGRPGLRIFRLGSAERPDAIL
jgi:arylsulfatase A-like enzyme